MSDQTEPETDTQVEEQTNNTKRFADMNLEEKVEFLSARNRRLESAVKGKSDDPEKDVRSLAKQRDALAKELETIKQSQMSDQEKILARAEAAERALQETTAARLRSDVALALGLTASQAKRLIGTTAEELEADAAELLADLKKNQPSAVATSDGQGKQGDPVGQAAQITSRDQLKSMTSQEIVDAKADGRLDGLMGVKK